MSAKQAQPMVGNQVRLSDVFPLPEEAEKLRVFIGGWSVEGSLSLEGRQYQIHRMAKASPVAAGWGVLVIDKFEIQGLGDYEEADILAFERGANVLHYFSVTNTAAAYDHKGRWTSDSKIDLRFEGYQHGKPYAEDLSFGLLGSDRLCIHESNTLDGHAITVMDVTMTRQS